MKKFDAKSLVLGILVGAISVSGVSIASAVSSYGKIESATFIDSKVYFYENEISLENPLVEIVEEGSLETQLYVPMEELLEYMQFNVDRNTEEGTVKLTMKGYTGYDNYNNTAVSSTIAESEADSEALDIIQKTGNWAYIEPYLSYMSNDAIEQVVEIYNSKHTNASEHKKASDYIQD